MVTLSCLMSVVPCLQFTTALASCYSSYISSLLDAPLMLLLEYAPYGDLLGYLRKSRGLEDKYYRSSECCQQEVTSYDLVSFSQQIASGMSFLASKKVWAFSIYKKFRKISIGNFRLGRARSICHKFHSREPRDTWPFKRPRKVWNW